MGSATPARHNRAMSSRKTSPEIDRTPLGRLVEAGLHDIVGYQLAQAAIAGHQVFAHQVGEAFEIGRAHV
jgi:hypothetical protein